MTERRSSTPPFEVLGVTFLSWIVPDGVNELGLPATRYEWRTGDGRGRVGRNLGEATYWARLDGRRVGGNWSTIRDPYDRRRATSGLTRAMQAVAGAMSRSAAV